MSDTLQAVSILTSLLQAASNSLQAAQKASQIVYKAQQEARDLTDDEWQQLDDYVAQARANAVAAAG